LNAQRQLHTRRSIRLACLLGLGILLYLPSFATPAFHGEESRRAIPAREMVASGNYVLPTIWGRPYLNKPPLYFWMVVGVARVSGAVDELSTRLPSVVSTIATGAAVYLFGSALLGEGAGLGAGLLFLLSFNVMGKGAIGEIEPPFTLACFTSMAALWAGRRGHRAALVASGLLLAAAALLKGPPAFLFFACAGLGIAASGEGWRFLRSARFWLPLLLGVVPLLAWALALLAQADTDQTLRIWVGEVTRTAGRSDPARYWTDRLGFAGSALGALLPASLLCALAIRTESGSALLRNPGTRFAGVVVLASLAYFLVAPGARPRYVYPMAPFACLAAGTFVTQAFHRKDRRALGRLRVVAALLLGAGALAATAGFLPRVQQLGDMQGLGAPGTAVLVALLLVCLLGLRGIRRSELRTAAACALAVIALARVFRLVEIIPQQEGTREIVARMHEFEAAIPRDADLGVNVAAMWNELVYLRRTLHWVDEPSALAGGDYLLLDDRARARFDTAVELEEVHGARIRSRRQLSLLRVGSPRGATGTPLGSPPP
jgi:4-amino-4-deoxy-L-arabinose transferase-like glycosyltransferase